VRKQFLAVLLVVVLALGVTGCRNTAKTSQQADLKGSDIIPLLLVVPDGNGGNDVNSKQKVLLAHWDLKEGKLFLQEEPVFTEKRGNEDFPKLVWDGGPKLFACSFGSQKTGGLAPGKVKGFSIQEVKVDYNPIPVAVQGSSRQGELLLAYSKQQFINSSATDGIIIEIHRGDKVEKSELRLPDFVSSGEVIPLLISGTPEHFILLALCSYSVEKMVESRLLVAEVQGKQISWKKIEGTSGGIVAGAGANLAKSGDKIYTTEPTLSAINMNNQNLKFEDFQEGNSLLAGLTQNLKVARSKYGDIYPQTQFGTYGDVLLMAYDLPDEYWIWAFRDEKLIGQLHFNNENNSLKIIQGDQVQEQTVFPNTSNGFVLPTDGYGQYK